MESFELLFPPDSCVVVACSPFLVWVTAVNAHWDEGCPTVRGFCRPPRPLLGLASAKPLRPPGAPRAGPGLLGCLLGRLFEGCALHHAKGGSWVPRGLAFGHAYGGAFCARGLGGKHMLTSCPHVVPMRVLGSLWGVLVVPGGSFRGPPGCPGDAPEGSWEFSGHLEVRLAGISGSRVRLLGVLLPARLRPARLKPWLGLAFCNPYPFERFHQYSFLRNVAHSKVSG